MKIKEIIVGESLSGNPGCSNGIYDIPVTVVFDNGQTYHDFACRCGHGCNGTFPLSSVSVGDEFADLDGFIDALYGSED